MVEKLTSLIKNGIPMNYFRFTTIAIISTILSACATAPKLLSAPPQKEALGTYKVVHSPLLDQTNHMVKPINADKDMIYVQSFGGSVAVGILLGPMGTIGNIMNISRITQNDIDQLFGKVNIQPLAIFNELTSAQGIAFSKTSTNPQKITPYVLIVKQEDDQLLLASSIIVEQTDVNNKPWVGRYVYQIPVKYTINQLAHLDENTTTQLKNSLATGFSKLLTRINDENSSMPEKEQKIKIKSHFIDPRFNFDIAGSLIAQNSDETWVRTFGVIYGIQKADIAFTTQ